jgi:hypothetical protein
VSPSACNGLGLDGTKHELLISKAGYVKGTHCRDLQLAMVCPLDCPFALRLKWISSGDVTAKRDTLFQVIVGNVMK